MPDILAPSDKSIRLAVDLLRADGLVAFPTETVYGLAARARSDEAVMRLRAQKGRADDSPLPVCIPNADAARELVTGWSGHADALTERYWPGPLTLVMPARLDRIAQAVLSGKETVALRCPDHTVAQQLLREVGEPLAAPSANPSGRTSPTNAEAVRAGFPDADMLILDGGACKTGVESTILLIDGPSEPRVLRSGAIGADELAAALATDIRSSASTPEHQSRNKPRTPVRLLEPDAPIAWPSDARVAVLSHRDIDVPPPHARITMASDIESFAATLYESIRRADLLGVDELLIDLPPGSGSLHATVMDRLRRLSGDA